MNRGNDHRSGIVRSLSYLVRLPVLTLLVVLEPVIAFACAAIALLGLLTTIFFKVIAAPHFPTLTMLSISLGFVVALVLYEGAIRLLSD
jgi:hypothetical protein